MTLVARIALTTLTTTDRSAETRKRDACAQRPACVASSRRAYTLIEVLVVAAIISILLVVAAVSWQRLSSREIESQAVNTLVSYASVVRAYAIDNHIETILAVDPNGTLRMYRRDVQTEGGVWTPSEFQPVGRELENLPEELAAAPIDPTDCDNGGNPWETWSGLCFDSSGRLIRRRANTSLGIAPPWALSSNFVTSYGIKIYRPERLVQHARKDRLDQVSKNDLANFLSDYQTPPLWEAVVLNQWNARPLPMK